MRPDVEPRTTGFNPSSGMTPCWTENVRVSGPSARTHSGTSASVMMVQPPAWTAPVEPSRAATAKQTRRALVIGPPRSPASAHVVGNIRQDLHRAHYKGKNLAPRRPVSQDVPSGPAEEYPEAMRTFNVVIERDPDTRLLVGYVPGWPGAPS